MCSQSCQDSSQRIGPAIDVPAAHATRQATRCSGATDAFRGTCLHRASATAPRSATAAWRTTRSGDRPPYPMDGPAAVLRWKEAHDSLEGFSGTQLVGRAEVLRFAATSWCGRTGAPDRDRERAAPGLHAGGRRGQWSHHAGGRGVLAERGITVVPDSLANAGGVTVSCFEWAQDQQKSLGTSSRCGSACDARRAARWPAW